MKSNTFKTVQWWVRASFPNASWNSAGQLVAGTSMQIEDEGGDQSDFINSTLS